LNPKGNPQYLKRDGNPALPYKVCKECKEKKKVTRFYKRSGLYKKYKESDVRRYDIVCKLCRKPTPSKYVGDPDYTKAEPLHAKRSRSAKIRHRDAAAAVQKKTRIRWARGKQQTRIATRLSSIQYLAKKGCKHCRERDPRKLEYDHITGSDKKHHVAKLISGGYVWTSEILQSEIRKCQILCANCHRVHTIKQQDYYKSRRVKAQLVTLAEKYDFKL
jgi:hypothetical protein